MIYVVFFKFIYIIKAFTGWDTNNKYEIQNSAGQRVYFAAEGGGFFPIFFYLAYI